MDPYTLTTGLILLRCTNITLYQFAFSIIHSNNVILIVFTATQQHCNYIIIIKTHMQSQIFHRLVTLEKKIAIAAKSRMNYQMDIANSAGNRKAWCVFVNASSIV